MEHDDLLQKVKFMIADQCSVPMEKLKGETRLLHDLGIDGDDAVELLERYGKEFGVDLATFKFDEYFGTEGCNPFCPFVVLFSVLFRRKKFRDFKAKPLTINDLVRAAESRQRQLAEIEKGLAEADRGEFASEDEMRAFYKKWGIR